MAESDGRRQPMSVADGVLALLFAAAILVVTAQVVWRYVFHNSLVWTEELARYLFIWMIFVGAVLALKENTHIRIDFVTDCLPRRVVRGLHILGALLVVAFMVFIVVVGFQWVLMNSARPLPAAPHESWVGLALRWIKARGGSPTPAMGLPLNYVYYAALPVAMLFGIPVALRRLVAAVRGKDEKAGPKEEGR